MNRQPFGTPPRWWEPKLSVPFVRLSRKKRRRQLENRQQVTEIASRGIEHVTRAVAEGKGVLIAPNHSAHYDSAALYAAADEVDLPLHFMVAWQVFGTSSPLECWAMQRLGCFSIDRESVDRQAFKQAVQILSGGPYPLVIFPEGDIYHTSDRVTPFREGAAAIALSAAKRAERPIVIVPCGIKFTYVDDPTAALHEMLTRLEERIYLRPQPRLPLADRIHRFAEAALALKELDYLGHTSSGRLRQRIGVLTECVLEQLESRHELRAGDRTPPERAKQIRQRLISELEDAKSQSTESDRFRQLQQDMEDVFFVMQCFSYPGDYLADDPSIERLAETVDKFEEDVFHVDVPTVHGRRRVQILFGEPMEAPSSRSRNATEELTTSMQDAVQSLLDEINTGRLADAVTAT